MERQRCDVVLSPSVAVVLTGRPFRSRRVGTLLHTLARFKTLKRGDWSDKGLISRRQPRYQGSQVVVEEKGRGGFSSWYRESEVYWRHGLFPYLRVVSRVEAGFRLLRAQQRDWATRRGLKTECGVQGCDADHKPTTKHPCTMRRCTICV